MCCRGVQKFHDKGMPDDDELSGLWTQDASDFWRDYLAALKKVGTAADWKQKEPLSTHDGVQQQPNDVECCLPSSSNCGW